MRVDVVGAGPAGLYLAILLRRDDPSHEITVLERNPPDATFGWGVVFSEDTMGALRDADEPTHAEIADTFARWDCIDVHYRGEKLRSRGHSFSAIRRTLLLDILQRRCRELGVELRFGAELTDPAELTGDLVVAADGVNSLLRRTHAAAFGSEVRPQGCTYIWFGTDLVLDAFTFVFVESEHGLFQAHAYPFDESTSTWIVECRPETWRAAGLDTADEAESIAFCERLFADALRGHRLRSNRSQWLTFQRVRNRSWHHGNVVLVGDAAHTAHFSIGSGTKLAMEDSIALAGALRRAPSLRAALVDYELERQPVVERFQQAADTSAAYFERVAGHTSLPPTQFAVNLLTRSGRVGHANLTLRDPAFGRAADARFAALGTAIAPPPAFTPFPLAGTVLANRVVSRSAADGAGLVLTGLVAVCPDGRVSEETPVAAEFTPPAADAPVAVL
ncbi:MAG TPA: FAD-dependent monooxygenase, partial [Pseudonocardiaceae bacterium]